MIQARPSDSDHMRWLNHLGIEPRPGQAILDVGCGSGFLCQSAIEKGAKLAVGLDIVTPDGLTGSAKWTFIQSDLNGDNWSQSLNRQTFDLIMAFDILEHLDAPFRFLANIRNCAAPGAKVVITTPNLLSWERYARPRTWSGARDPQHKTLFTRYSLEFILAKAGFNSTVIKAPLRSLGGLSGFTPQIGGQMVCVATPSP